MRCSSKAAYGFWSGDIADNPLQMLRCVKSGIKQKRVIARSLQGDAAISGRFGTVSTRLLRCARNDERFLITGASRSPH
jgi:hypothetical protein